MDLLVFYILIITLSYFCLIIFYLIKWSRYALSGGAVPEHTNQISVIIPVYNDGEKLKKLLNALIRQSISYKDFEVIIIDDHSEISHQNIMSSTKLKDLSIRLIQNTYDKGKKYALKTGVDNANYSWIVSTDADCIPHEKWLETIREAFRIHNPKLISAPVVMSHDHSLFQKFQSFEFSSLVGTGAASVASGSPIMCNGANLAFQKQLFIDAFPELKPELKSGDDIFLLEYAKRYFPEDIIFLKDYNAIVSTDAESGLLKFFKQRIRWTSKSLFYNDPVLIIVSSLVFLLNLNIVFTIVLSFGNSNLLYLVFVQYGIKSIADFLFLRNILKFQKREKLMRIFPVVQIIYPFYILSVSIVGLIVSFFYKYVKVFRK